MIYSPKKLPKKEARKKTRKSNRSFSSSSSDSEERLVINLAYSKYPIIKKIAKEDFNLKISKNPNNENWDLLWADTVK